MCWRVPGPYEGLSKTYSPFPLTKCKCKVRAALPKKGLWDQLTRVSEEPICSMTHTQDTLGSEMQMASGSGT